MFKLYEDYEGIGNNLKCDFIRYLPSKISTINIANSQNYIKIPREDSVISLLNIYLGINFDVLHAVTNNRYIDNDDIILVDLGPSRSNFDRDRTRRQRELTNNKYQKGKYHVRIY